MTEDEKHQARVAAVERAVRDGWQFAEHGVYWGDFVYRRGSGDYLRLDVDRLICLYPESEQ